MKRVIRFWPRSVLFILAAAFLLITFWPFVASGQTTQVATFPPGEDNIVVVRKGDPAPFTGQLFDAPTAIRWGNWLEQYKVRLKLDVETEQKICKVEVDYRDQLLVAEQAHEREVVQLHAKALEEARARARALEEELANPPWYTTPEFGAALGIGATLGAVILGVVIVNAGTGG